MYVALHTYVCKFALKLCTVTTVKYLHVLVKKQVIVGRLFLTIKLWTSAKFFVDALVRIPHTFIGGGDCETKIV